MKAYEITPSELENEFYSFQCSKKELHWILTHTMDSQYICVTRGAVAKEEYLNQHPELRNTNGHAVTNKTRFGYCTFCHHSFRIPDNWTIEKMDTQYPFKRYSCPYCHKEHQLIYAGKGMMNKVLGTYVTFFSRSRKNKDVILAKNVVAYLPMDQGYRDVRPIAYVVGMMRMEIGKGTIYYCRDVDYAGGKFKTPFWYSAGDDGIGTSWNRVERIGPGDVYKWSDRGLVDYVDWDSLDDICQTSAWRYCAAKYFRSYYEGWSEGAEYAYTAVAYLDLYSRFPQIEYMVKGGLIGCVLRKIHGQSTYPAIKWQQYKSPKQMIRFVLTKREKKHLYELQEEHSPMSVNALNMLTVMQQTGKRCTLEEASMMQGAYSSMKDNGLLNDKNLPSAHQIIMYCEKQLDKMMREHGQMGLSLRACICDYLDYFKEIKELGYDLTDRQYLRPRDLYEAHRHSSEAVRLKMRADIERRHRQYAEQQVAMLEERNKKLQSYCFHSDLFFIRPLQTVEEFIREGAVNHNCVATYTDSHAKGDTTILAVRQKAAPDDVFYTMEVRDNQIMQCRTKNNEPAQAGTAVYAFVKQYEKEILQPKRIKRGA